MIKFNHLKIAPEEMFPGRDLFTHPTDAHGEQHVHRVICLGLLLARSMGWAHIMPEVWAAAYLHDLRRVRDGVDPEHGLRAAEAAAEFEAFFIRAGVRDLRSVIYAVEQHDEPDSFNHFKPEKDSERILCVLKDADALDRVRFGNTASGLDTRFLRLPRSYNFVGIASHLFSVTHAQKLVGVEIWDHFLKFAGCGDELMVNGDKMSEPEQFHADYEEWIEALKSCRGLRKDRVEGQIKMLELHGPQWGEHEGKYDALTLVTFMRPEGVEDCRKHEQVRSFWDLHAQGALTQRHHLYTDCPEHSHFFNDLHCFGRRFFGVFGVVLPPNTDLEKYPFSRQARTLAGMYGDQMVVWKPTSLPPGRISISINDSQECGFTVPYSHQAACGLVAFGLHREKTQQIPLNFIEFQYHGRLNFYTDRLTTVTIPDPRPVG